MNGLASFTVRVTETEIDTHHIISADSELLAERGVQEMGCTWWEMLEEEVDGCCWRFPEGEVTFSRWFRRLMSKPASCWI